MTPAQRYTTDTYHFAHIVLWYRSLAQKTPSNPFLIKAMRLAHIRSGGEAYWK